MRAIAPAILLAAGLLGGCQTPAARAEQRALDEAAHLPAADGRGFGDGSLLVGEPQQCINQSNITRTQVVSDRVIDVSVGGRIFRNVLPNACPRLGFERRIAYEVRGGQLCRNDLFRVLDAAPSIPGPVCMLGEFQRIERPPGRRDLR